MGPECAEQVTPRGPLFLLDGNNIAYRAFFALPPEISTSGGFPTNALYGFCSMVIKILSEYKPEAVIVAWDSREKTFRHHEFEAYKAQRKPMPDLLSEQWPYLEEFSSAFGFINLALPGFEADDILATLATQAESEGRETVVVTGDRDALQLASDHVSIMANTRGVTEVKVYDPAAVEERYGVPPRLIPDLIGLKGDTSDNIPGIPGIGEKTAALLLGQFGSLESVLEHAEDVSGAKRRELLVEHREVAVMSKKLALVDRNVPIDIHAAEVAPHKVDPSAVEELFNRFEFNSLLERVRPFMAVLATEEEPAGETLVCTPEVIDGTSTDFERAVGEALDLTAIAGLAAGPPRGDAGLGRFAGERPVENDDAVWIAQPPRLLEVQHASSAKDALRGLLHHRGTACHDLKSSPGLRALVDNVGHDTYLAAYLLAPGRRGYPFQELCREAGLWAPECGASSAAEAADAVMVAQLASCQERALREQGMWELFRDVELPLTRVLIAMEEVGIHLDCYRLGEITGKIEDQMEGLEAHIYELAGEEFNLGSPQQLGQILFERLGLARQRKTKTGYSTDAKTLEALRECHPIVSRILTHRELSKLMSTYLLALPQAVDQHTGRLHTTFHQTVTATGRLSSSDPNLQNIPVRTALGAQIRGCFTAEPGYSMVVADYSQIELRIMAYLSGERTLQEAFERGEDIHTRTAAEVFGMAEDQVDATHRRYAKAVNFGIMYGISAFGLSQNLGTPREEAAAYIDRYFERMPHVKAFIETTVEQARRDGFVATVFGRRRPIPELQSGNYQERSLGERLAVNSVIQGSAADIIKVAMIRCHERLEREFPDAKLVLQVHDELVFEVPAGHAEAVKEAVMQEMTAAFPLDPPLGVDAGIGPDWLSAK